MYYIVNTIYNCNANVAVMVAGPYTTNDSQTTDVGLKFLFQLTVFLIETLAALFNSSVSCHLMKIVDYCKMFLPVQVLDGYCFLFTSK